MNYRKIVPSKPLTAFVECYFAWEGEAIEELEVQTPPNCKGAIVFNHGDPTWAKQNSSEPALVPDSFICGQFTSNFQRILKGKIGMIGVVFKPTAIHNFFGLRMSNLVNNRMPLDLLIGKEAPEMLEKIKMSNENDRVQLLEQFLLKRMGEAKTRLSIIDEVADHIDEKKGLVTVDQLAEKFKISRRYLEKHFLEKVGVSPKLYSRLKRFVFLSIELAYENNSDWQALIEKAGLHDQSHLIKEFLEFDKTTPTKYFNTHREMTRFLKR